MNSLIFILVSCVALCQAFVEENACDINETSIQCTSATCKDNIIVGFDIICDTKSGDSCKNKMLLATNDVICRGSSICTGSRIIAGNDVFCTFSKACIAAKIEANRNVICETSSSCATEETVINACGSVTCGLSSCKSNHINAGDSVLCDSEDACELSIIYSEKDIICSEVTSCLTATLKADGNVWCSNLEACAETIIKVGYNVYCNGCDSCKDAVIHAGYNTHCIAGVGSFPCSNARITSHYDVICERRACELTQSIKADHDVLCYGDRSCRTVFTIQAGNNVACYGDLACSDSISIEALGDITCHGLFACDNPFLTAASIHCTGEGACSKNIECNKHSSCGFCRISIVDDAPEPLPSDPMVPLTSTPPYEIIIPSPNYFELSCINSCERGVSVAYGNTKDCFSVCPDEGCDIMCSNSEGSCDPFVKTDSSLGNCGKGYECSGGEKIILGGYVDGCRFGFDKCKSHRGYAEPVYSSAYTQVGYDSSGAGKNYLPPGYGNTGGGGFTYGGSGSAENHYLRGTAGRDDIADKNIKIRDDVVFKESHIFEGRTDAQKEETTLPGIWHESEWKFLSDSSLICEGLSECCVRDVFCCSENQQKVDAIYCDFYTKPLDVVNINEVRGICQGIPPQRTDWFRGGWYHSSDINFCHHFGECCRRKVDCRDSDGIVNDHNCDHLPKPIAVARLQDVISVCSGVPHPVPECLKNSDCFDGLKCTTDYCSYGHCHHFDACLIGHQGICE